MNFTKAKCNVIIYAGKNDSLQEEKMELIIVFVVFVAAMIMTIILGHSMIWALLLGLILFSAVGLRRGYKVGQLAKWGWDSIRDSLVVIEVMFIIGLITAAWRVSGTITVFVYYGMKVIVPPMFLIITFLLSCLLSYALGTSFGVAGTVGVIFMALARSGGVDPVITAGVIMSGIYFGDRGAPVSSSANMVAGITKTDILVNVRYMMKSCILPFIITLIVYAVLSVMNPISGVDAGIVRAFEEEFTLSLWAFVPAVLMLLLPLVKVGVIASIVISTISSVIIACLVQGVALLEVLKILVMGYESSGEGIGAILNGGGMISMLEVVGILLLSCAYSGIFSGTGMLNGLLEIITKGCRRFGRFAMSVTVSVVSSALFCNQTISTLMCSDLLTKPYLETDGSRQELAIDMENSVILIACMIPWSIGCTVPLTFMGADIRSVPWAVYMYLVPLCYFFTKKHWFENRDNTAQTNE